MIVYTRVPDPPRPRRPRARARGAAGRAPGVGPPAQTRSTPRATPVPCGLVWSGPRGRVPRVYGLRMRPGEQRPRPTGSRLTCLSAGKHAIRGAAPAPGVSPGPPGGTGRVESDLSYSLSRRRHTVVCATSDCSQAPSHTLDGRGQSHTHMIAAIHSLIQRYMIAPAIRLRGSPPAAARSYTLCYDGL